MNLYNTSIPSLILLLHVHLPYSISTSQQSKPLFQAKSNRCHQLAFFASSSSSCPAPRFDTFTDNILGPWEECHYTTTTTTTTTKRGEVEEVMRSCGGAVQGITEIPLLLPPPLPNHDDDDDTSKRAYHNRADDGFLFFDCGSYISLPIDVSSGIPSGAIPNNIMCSLSFPTMTKRQKKIRTIMTTGPPSFQTLVRSSSRSSSDLNTKKEKEGDDDGNDENIVNRYRREIVLPLTCAPESIRWEKGISCRMSSPGQPWMLQRASWEQYLRDDIDGDGGDASSSIQNEEEPNRRGEVAVGQSRMEVWITSFNADENRDSDGEGRSKLSSSIGMDGIKRGVVVPEGTSTILQMGSRCRITDEVKAILCFYGNKHEVKGVSLQEGHIQEQCHDAYN